MSSGDPKHLLKQGTGTETLRTYFNDMITDKEFAEKKAAIKAADDVEIQDKEQLLYYEVFRKKFGKPKDVFPKIKAAFNVQNARATLKQRFSSAKFAELTPSKFSFIFSNPKGTIFSNISRLGFSFLILDS